MAEIEPTRSYKVLVVEDEGLIAHDIASRLEALGHEVLGPASTAEEALALAPGAEIVLMDIRIDGPRDGIDAAIEIRSHKPIPVVFLTAHADRSTLERAKLAGPLGYIVKPLGPSSLQAAIEIAVAKHRVESLLEERETWLRAAIAWAADGVVVCTAEGRVRLLNRSAELLTGWTQEEAEGRPLQKVIRLIEGETGGAHGPGASGDVELDPLPLALLRDEPVEFNPHCRLVSRDGREMEVDGFIAPVRSSQDLLGAVLTFRDASARRWEERQIQQTQKLEAAASLAAGAANEYTNLISTIRNQAERLVRQFAGYSAARIPLEEIQQAATAADQVTRCLAAFGSRQVGRPEALSLNGILRRMARLIESAAGDRIRVAILPGPDAGQIMADATQIESAVMNLVNHACAAMRDGGQLQIETARAELPRGGRTTEYVLLAISYSITDPDIDRLFDPVFNSAFNLGSTHDSDAGPGLALAAVYSAVTESGGYVTARPSPNGGSRIDLLLPRLSGQALLQGPANPCNSEATTILLVDGRDSVRADLHNFFEASGYNLLEASDAAEAIALGEMRDGVLDLVIADSGEAEMIGRTLRGTHPSLRVLSVVQGPENGPGEIRRPFTRHGLLQRVSGLLGAPERTATSSLA